MPARHAVGAQVTSISSAPAILVLASGEAFMGEAFGAVTDVVGEVVFNTALTGYQEILSDPSYRGQLVCMTAPHIGIVGVNERDAEAPQPQASALLVRDLARHHSNWRADRDLDGHMAEHGVMGLAGIDTRRLTRLLRDRGAVNGCLMAGTDPAAALERARACAPMAGNALGATAGRPDAVRWAHGAWDMDRDRHTQTEPATAPNVAVLDCGAKHAIMQELTACGLQVTVVPYAADAATLAADHAGVVLSNGPGDPEPLAAAIDLARDLLAREVPLLGICLGHQVLALAAGARTEKMKFGHHGANHPVLDHATGQVFISSQNHGFAVCAAGLPAHLEVTHTSLFDGSIQGLAHRAKPARSFQGHPEASPGPRELRGLFAAFATTVTEHATAA